MAGYIVVGTLAAIGLLSVVWACFGWLIPGAKGGALVCVGSPDAALAVRCRWLRELGLLKVPLIVIVTECGEDPVQPPGCEGEICSPEALVSRLEWERKCCDGTGNGDPSGRGERRGISEL